MAIKYKIELGDKAQNMLAQDFRDSFVKPLLKGKRCNCGNGDTTITAIGPRQISVSACCPKFHQEIDDLLNTNLL
jgi:hypothetical protein